MTDEEYKTLLLDFILRYTAEVEEWRIAIMNASDENTRRDAINHLVAYARLLERTEIKFNLFLAELDRKPRKKRRWSDS